MGATGMPMRKKFKSQAVIGMVISNWLAVSSFGYCDSSNG